MWSSFKSMPVLPKVVIICLLLAFVYKVSTVRGSNRSGSMQTGSMHYTPVSDDRQGYGSQRQTEADDSDRAGNRDQENAARQNLAQYQAQQAQLVGRMRQCQEQMTEATNRQGMAAMQGVMYNQRPACEAYMPQWISQEALLETEIARTQNPNDHRTLREITGIAPYNPSSSSSGRTASNDGGLSAAENFDREAIRGNSIYTDESGQSHELPTRDYYYRDRSSGQIVGSDQATPPNNGRDYEQFNSANQPE